MTQSRRCSQCGAQLAGEADECPACLMRLGFSPTQSEAVGEDGLALTQSLAEQAGRGAASIKAGRDLPVGDRFGDYRIVGRLGHGGMGVVYEADHLDSARRVALKVLSHSLDNPEARARFLREGRLAASINHPNSVYVYGTEEIEHTPTISMELIRGGTLQQVVKARGPMGTHQAVDAILQVIEGLEAAGRKGVLHRDIKPANCFIDETGLIKIGDFGLSISTGSRDAHEVTNVTREGTFLGTPTFASPEQLRGEPLDLRSDVYSVGVTLFYLLTGQTPFAGENMIQLLATVLDKPAPSVRTVRADVPEDLDRIIARCLQKSAGQRFANYASLREALLPLSSKTAIPATLGNRLLASIVDNSLWAVVGFPLSFWWMSDQTSALAMGPGTGMSSVMFLAFTLMMAFSYYWICEWQFGATLGKRLLGLRVMSNGCRLSLGQAIGRAAIFLLLPTLPNLIFNFAVADWPVELFQSGRWLLVSTAIGLSCYLILAGLFATARKKNGFAAVHDLLTHTRVVNRYQSATQTQTSVEPDAFDVEHEAMVGPYHVLETLRDIDDDRLLLAYDAKLLRRVWLHERAIGTAEVGKSDRNLSRTARLRWLGARRSDAECWDCYEGPPGVAFLEAADQLRDWGVARGVLRELAAEIQTACQEDSCPSRLSLDRIWITDEHHPKLLPFDAPAKRAGAHDRKGIETANQHSGDGESTGASEARAAAGLELLRSAAKQIHEGLGVPGAADSSMPLSGRDQLQRLGRAVSWEAVNAELRSMQASPAINVSRRIAGLVAATYALPVMILFSSLIVGYSFHRESRSMPEVKELGQLAFLLNFELDRAEAGNEQRVEALEKCIAGNYRDVIENRQTMNSLFALVTVPAQMRQPLQDAIDHYDPTAEEIADAETIVEEIREDDSIYIPNLTAIVTPKLAFFTSSFMWLQVIWFPSLITAVAFRGGLILRIFGLTLVNRRGQPASRLRVLVRMILTGVPILAILVVASLSFGTSLMDTKQRLLMQILPVSIMVGLFILAVILPCKQRLFSDRLAGTVIVAQ